MAAIRTAEIERVSFNFRDYLTRQQGRRLDRLEGVINILPEAMRRILRLEKRKEQIEHTGYKQMRAFMREGQGLPTHHDY